MTYNVSLILYSLATAASSLGRGCFEELFVDSRRAVTPASALVAYVSMELYDATAVMAGVFVIAAMGIGVAADIMRAEAVK